MKQWKINDAQVRITKLGLENSTAKLAPAGSVLVVVRSGVLKHTVPVAIAERSVAINQDMKALICSENLDPSYLAYFIKERSRAILQWVRATTADNFPIDDLMKSHIPLPSVSEQRRISQILDRSDVLRVKRHESLKLLDDLAQSIFRDMFGDVATNNRGWDDHQTLDEVALIGSGITKGRRAPSQPLRSVPYMTVANVQDQHLDLSTVKEIEATADEIDRYRLLKNDLLLTEGGDPDKLGRGTLWRNELPECIHQNHIFRVRLREESGIDPVFLNWLVASNRGRRYFLRSAKQTTGIASINATQLRNFPLLAPPVKLQQEFAARVSQLEQCKSSHDEHLAELDALFASLRHRAFRGELRPDSAAHIA
jgi:type I restriction enzyme S subunit